MSNDTQLISIREFGRRVGVAESSVRKRINKGDFTKGVQNDEKGRPKMKLPEALDEWSAMGGGVAKAIEGNEISSGIPAYAISKAENEYYRAQTAKLDYEHKAGSLVEKDAVYKALLEYGVELRTAILSVPKLVVDDVMSCTDRGQAIELIYSALENQLEKFTSEGVLDKERPLTP